MEIFKAKREEDETHPQALQLEEEQLYGGKKFVHKGRHRASLKLELYNFSLTLLV